MLDVPLSPNLTAAKAAALISARPEFNKYATLVTISSTTRGADSLKYDEHAWHLSDFWYGEPPDVKTVNVGRDDAPSTHK